MLQESKKEIASLQSEEKKLSRLKETAKTGNEVGSDWSATDPAKEQTANLQGSRAQMRGLATHTQAKALHILRLVQESKVPLRQWQL
ncbi:hypothetical protein YC2023_097571 [Brassica napus]